MTFAIGGLALLGYHSISIWADGLEGARLAEFAEVAEQIRQDVKRKLDAFMQQEQNRPYTDYQYYSVGSSPVAQQQLPLVISPLAGKIENDLAFGNFQVQPDGSVITPYYAPDQSGNTELAQDAEKYIDNVGYKRLPKLNANELTSREAWRKIQPAPTIEDKAVDLEEPASQVMKAELKAKGVKSRRAKYQIESLQKQEQQVQVIEQQRDIASSNVRYRLKTPTQQTQMAEPSLRGRGGRQIEAEEQSEQVVEVAKIDEIQESGTNRGSGISGTSDAISSAGDVLSAPNQKEGFDLDMADAQQQAVHAGLGMLREPAAPEDTVQIRIEPFAPIVVPGGRDDSIFAGQIFLLRHVQIENEHLLQGFQLNEQRLIEEIHDSASRFIREGMDFCLGKTENKDAAYSAVMDFGFGTVTLNMMETDPHWVGRQIGKLQVWYFSIVTVVVIAMLLVILSLWQAMNAQVKLAEQKDDFISAVSHELRTPLTSIRMYAEMLEKDWVKSQDKAREYYKGMRQESERLSRLIENVLDFSRIQKGRKKYSFVLGDLNESVKAVTEVMRSYAAQAGFTIQLEPAELEPITFDADAVTQVVINLLDNAVKYAHNAEDKTIKVRTRSEGHFVVIEVEDHGPGIPHKQQDKVFDVFYRCEAEATRQTKGTGLGLALVSKFAQAHDGFVEILAAKPHGAIFRVGLAIQF